MWNSLSDRTVLRGGFGITYLPSNTGYFSATFNPRQIQLRMTLRF